MRKWGGVLVFSVLLALSAKTGYAQIPALPGAEGSPFGSYLNMETPIMHKVSNAPEAPAANEEVTVTIEVANDPQKTDDVTEEANLFYSTDDGKAWAKVEMEQDENNERIFKGKIPGQAAGTNVTYYIQAKDSAGNVATEMPGKNSVWPPSKDAPILLANIGPDEDDNDAAVEPDLDLTGIAVGYDDSFIYGVVKVQGTVQGGTQSPPYIMAYLLATVNPDKGEDILKSGTAFGYIPLAPAIGASIAGWQGNESMIDATIADTKQVLPESQTGEATLTDGGNLYFKYKKSVLGSNPGGVLKFLAVTAAATCTDLISSLSSGNTSGLTSCLLPKDASKYLYAYFRNHTYAVK